MLGGTATQLVQINCAAVRDGDLRSRLTIEAIRAAQADDPLALGAVVLSDLQDLALPDQAIVLEETGQWFVAHRDGDLSVIPRLFATLRGDPAELARTGALRHELALLVAQEVLAVPPLRERIEDLPALFENLVSQVSKTMNRQVTLTLRPEVREKLAQHDWPGNLLELEQVITRALGRTTSNVLLDEDIEISDIRGANPVPGGPSTARGQFQEAICGNFIRKTAGAPPPHLLMIWTRS